MNNVKALFTNITWSPKLCFEVTTELISLCVENVVPARGQLCRERERERESTWESIGGLLIEWLSCLQHCYYVSCVCWSTWRQELYSLSMAESVCVCVLVCVCVFVCMRRGETPLFALSMSVFSWAVHPCLAAAEAVCVCVKQLCFWAYQLWCYTVYCYNLHRMEALLHQRDSDS